MISSAASRASQLALRRSCLRARQSRSYAAAAAPAAPAYEPTSISGVHVVSKDSQGPTTKLAIVAKAGTRYQPGPGLTAGLEGFAFKNTLKRSALRITRESELLGGQLTSYHTREAIVLEASFLREHLPYFTELLGEVVSSTKFNAFELAEDIEPVLHIKQAKHGANPLAVALDVAHNAAFHTGLGEPLYPTPATPLGSYLTDAGVASFASAAYTKPNFALVAAGASSSALAKWVEPFFKSVSSTAAATSAPASKYYGGQQRVESTFGSAVVIGFSTPGLAAGADPAAAVLAALLGGASSIKWSPGFSLLSKAVTASVGGPSTAQVVAENLVYSDAGLLTLQVSGLSPAVIRKAAEEAVKVVKGVADAGVSKEDLAKAIAKAKFDALVAEESSSASVTAAGTAVIHGLKTFQAAETLKAFESVTADKVKSLAKQLLDSKATFSAVGDLHALPFAEDLGLKV